MPASPLHVAPDGRDTWSGRRPTPNATRTDGPLASLAEAQQRARASVASAPAGEVVVQLQAGRYPLAAPLRFDARDSGRVTYRAAPGATVILDGGIPVTGWQTTTVHDRPAWVTDARPLLDAGCPLRSLFVDGHRRPRPRWPLESDGWLWIEDVPGRTLKAALYDGAHAFVARPGDLDPAWPNLTDIDVLVSHFWVSERMPLAAYDAASRRVTSTRQSIFCLRDSYSPRWAKYRLENVFAALRAPGQWYFDRAGARLLYLPMPGEDPATTVVTVPRALQLLRVEGTAAEPVHGLRFEGITFSTTEWQQPGGHGRWWDPYAPPVAWPPRDSYAHNLGSPPPAGRDYATSPQAAFEVPGVIQFAHATDCAVEDCIIEHTGFHGIVAGEGCKRLRLVGNTLRDLGAGGILADGGAAGSPASRHTSHLRITDNTITGGGHVFPAACGIATLHGYRHLIAHNAISDLTYSGISCGWVWGYAESISRENRIERNHIHGLGRRAGLSDLGGIYLLGVQPGTVVRGNWIHDLVMANYGAWGLYLDQGASFITVEDNVVHDTQTEAYHEHWGRQNLVRNNLFARSHATGLVRLCPEPWGDDVTYPAPGGLIIGNVLLPSGRPVYADHERYLRAPTHTLLGNLHWDPTTATAPVAWQDRPWAHTLPPEVAPYDHTLTLAELQARGLELHSVAADPRPLNTDLASLRFAAGSPALALGFRPLDVTFTGPRPPDQRD